MEDFDKDGVLKVFGVIWIVTTVLLGLVCGCIVGGIIGAIKGPEIIRVLTAGRRGREEEKGPYDIDMKEYL